MSDDIRIGFFTRTDLKKGRARKSTRPTKISDERLHKLECRACPLNRAPVRSPKMEPTGPESAPIYFLGAAPTDESDRENEPFLGRANERLRRLLGQRWEKVARWNHVIRDRPEGGRQPKPIEIECCRPSVEKDIAETKPAALFVVGQAATKWLGMAGGVGIWRGRRVPVEVGGHTTWAFPLGDPESILFVEGNNADHADDLWRLLKRDLSTALSEFRHLDPPKIYTKDELTADTTFYTGARGDLDALRRALDRLRDQDIAFDLETRGLRPYEPQAAPLSIALSTTDETHVVALHHPEATWDHDIEEVEELLREFFTGDFEHGARRIAQNAVFDVEWVAALWGEDFAWGVRWECTKVQAYILDSRKGSLNLAFLSKWHLGVSVKTLSPKLNMSRLDLEPLHTVMVYNGLDARATALIYEIQTRLLDEEGLSKVYTLHRQRTPAIVLAQITGVPVHQPTVVSLKEGLQEQIEPVIRRMKNRPEVIAFERGGTSWNPRSDPDLARVFRDILGRREVITESGGVTTKEQVLRMMSDEPLAGLLLKFREFDKLLGTYVLKMEPTHEKTVVYPDGRMHTNYNPTQTVTNRLASEDPNLQNIPKRNHREIRGAIRVPNGFRLVAADYGQIEFRAIGFMSQDAKLCAAIADRYDVHGFWADVFIAEHRQFYRRLDKDRKACRGVAKNGFVFPLCFGAKTNRIAGELQVPKGKARRWERRFWDEFGGVKKWQAHLQAEYNRRGHVETMTGFRRRSPVGWNELINMPVQGTTADIVLDAMARLSRRSVEEEWPALRPIMQVHDELVFIIPVQELDAAIDVIVRDMLFTPFDFVTTPLCVEVEVGRDWNVMKSAGEFFSDDPQFR